jgi:hypothetical protein
VAQALDVPIALLERRAALEAARQQYPSDSGPTDADVTLEEQVGRVHATAWPTRALLLQRASETHSHRMSPTSRVGSCTRAGVACIVQTAAAVAAHASMLAGMLEPADGSAVQLTPFGRLAPPLGLARVKVAELFAALLGVGSASAGTAVAAAGVLPRTLALVLQFPFNNILHAQVPRPTAT